MVGIFSEDCAFQYIYNNEIISIDDSMKFSDILDYIKIENSKETIKFVSKDKLYDEVVNDFIYEFKCNNELSCIMITDNGKAGEFVLGIITTWDVIGKEVSGSLAVSIACRIDVTVVRSVQTGESLG